MIMIMVINTTNNKADSNSNNNDTTNKPDNNDNSNDNAIIRRSFVYPHRCTLP